MSNFDKQLRLVSQLFFSFMAVALLGVKYKSDKRDIYLHHGNWMVKLGLWLLFCILPFFFPNGLVSMYGACQQPNHDHKTVNVAFYCSA